MVSVASQSSEARERDGEDRARMRGPARGLAAIRIVTGLWFLKSISTKITWTLAGGILPLPAVSERWIGFLPERLTEYAQSGPPAWYHAFLVGTAIPNGALFAKLTAVGEILVGLSLTLGALTVLGSLGGLWLILNYLIGSWGLGLNQQGLHVMLITCFLVFIVARAGRRWGLDGWLVGNGGDGNGLLPRLG